MSHVRNVITLRRLLIAASLALLAACGEAQLSREELLDRSRAALAAEDLNAAVIDVKTALQQSPGDAEGRRLYGEILLRQRDLSQASEELRKSLDIAFDPQLAIVYAETLVDGGAHQQMVDLNATGYFDAVAGEPAYLAALARAEAADGNYFVAVGVLDAAEAKNATLPSVRRARALVLAQHGGDLVGASEILVALLEEIPDDADAWSLYSAILQAQGNLPEAERAAARAGEINPYRLRDRINHMTLLLEQEKYDEVRAVLDELEKLLPDHPGVNYAQARLAMIEGDSDQALEELDAVLMVAPQDYASLYLSANVNLQRGNLAMAQSQIENFLAERPNNINARLMLATIHLQKGQTGKALDMVREVLEQRPENETAMLLHARVLAAERNYDDSAIAYADLVAVRPESASLRAEYGEALLRAGETERGAAELAKTLKLAPEDTGLRTQVINTRIELGQLEAARADIAEFSADFPDQPEPALLLAKVSLAEQDIEGAKRHLQAALDLDPGNALARRGLAGLAIYERDPDQAMAVLSGDLEAVEPDLQNLINLAAVMERQGDLEGMEQALRRAIDTHPAELMPRLLLARYVLTDGRPGEAVDLLMTVRDSHEDDSRLQRILVGAFIALDEPTAAVSAGRQLAALEPDDPVALRLAARAEHLAGNLPEAQKLLSAAVDLAPADLETRKLLIQVLMEQGDIDGIGKELANFNDTFADEQLVELARGRLFGLDVGNREAAEKLLRRAHQRQPNTVSLLFLSTALIQNREVDYALDLLDGWVETYPKDGVILNQIGALRAAFGQDEMAAKAYEQFLKLYPEDTVAMNNLAWSLRKSDPQRSLELVEAALQQAPGNPTMLDTKAMALMYAGEYDAALEALDQVTATLGDIPPVAYHRAEVLLAAERKEEARAVLNELVARDPFPEQERARNLLNSL